MGTEDVLNEETGEGRGGIGFMSWNKVGHFSEAVNYDEDTVKVAVGGRRKVGNVVP